MGISFVFSSQGIFSNLHCGCKKYRSTEFSRMVRLIWLDLESMKSNIQSKFFSRNAYKKHMKVD